MVLNHGEEIEFQTLADSKLLVLAIDTNFLNGQCLAITGCSFDF